MNISNLIKKLFYYLFTSGLFVAISLLILENISFKFNLVNFFAFASASFFILNLMQYNVVAETNVNAVKGFLNHTLLGVTTYWLLAFTMILLFYLNYTRSTIITIILSMMILSFVGYFSAYYYGYLNYIN